MTKRTKHVGRDPGNPSSSAFLSPRGPQTGDGKTRRSIFDGVKLAFQVVNGSDKKK